MNAAFATACAFVLYALGYRIYARFLGERLFALDPKRVTPAHRYEDGDDFVPTRRFVLFGHHWASITGLAPMLGPAVAVIWGFIPAMLWIVFGALLVGCVHDFAALVLSMRARGASVGKIAEGIMGKRAKALFLSIIFFGIALAMGVFTIYISGLFSGAIGRIPMVRNGELVVLNSGGPSAVLPSAGLMIIAAIVGYLVQKRGLNLTPLAIGGFILLLLLVWAGQAFPISYESRVGWNLILLAYALAASVLPVWSLLQPRDFLNSQLLYLGLLLAFVGFFISAPEFSAPAINPHPHGAPPLFPFVFITIACGAASGFHGLVASGTTAKQIANERDAKFIGYGGMIGESLLGLLAVLAVSAGFTLGEASPKGVWQDHYAGWADLNQKALPTFILGTARFVERLGIDYELGVAFIAVLVISFALTTLDSATRLLRYNIEEIGNSLGLKVLANRYVASASAVVAIGFFTFYEIDGKPAGVALWRLFGTTNQLLAGLTLLTATLYLLQRGKSPWFTGVPMVLMLGTSLLAMIGNLRDFVAKAEWPLVAVGTLLLLLGAWLVLEAALTTRRILGSGERIASVLVFVEDREEEATALRS